MEASTSKTSSRRSPRRTKQTSQATASSEDLRERIAMRAYAIYEGRLRQGALDDWLQAEREILGTKDNRVS